MERCTGGSDCSDPTCFLMHPCVARNCRHYGKVWLTSDHFKYNANKRFKTCQENRANRGKVNAVTSERKRQRREEVELETFPELDLSEEGKAAAVTSAQKEFDLQLAGARVMYPSRVLSCNIFGASTGCKGYSIVQEGEKSTLTERGYDTPAIVASSSTPSRPWRALNGRERRQLGPPAAIIYDAGRSKELSTSMLRSSSSSMLSSSRGSSRSGGLWELAGQRDCHLTVSVFAFFLTWKTAACRMASSTPSLALRWPPFLCKPTQQMMTSCLPHFAASTIS